MQQLLLKCIFFSSSRVNFNPSLRPFKFIQFRSNNASLSNNNVYLINNIASLLNNNSFLMAICNFSQLLGFHHHSPHHIHHIHSFLFFFILISVLYFILHYIFICIIALIVDWGWLLFDIWMLYIWMMFPQFLECYNSLVNCMLDFYIFLDYPLRCYFGLSIDL